MNSNSIVNRPPAVQLPRSHTIGDPPVAIGDPPVAIGDLFKIGIGPSSSHTMGPMKAAGLFLQHLDGRWDQVHRLRATVYGSLAWTGKGHATDKALILGLAGERAESIDPDQMDPAVARIRTSGRIRAIATTPATGDC